MTTDANSGMPGVKRRPLGGIFLLVGAVNTAVGYVVFLVLLAALGRYLHYNVILTIAYAIASLTGYLLHRNVTFLSKVAALNAGTNPVGEPVVGLIVRRAVADLGFSTSKEYVVDLDFWMRLLARGPMLMDPAVRCSFRIHGGSWGRSMWAGQVQQTVEYLGDLASEDGEALPRRTILKAYGRSTARNMMYAIAGNF